MSLMISQFLFTNVPAILLAGDLNSPDLRFEDGNCYTNHNPAYGYEINSFFVEMMNDYGLTICHSNNQGRSSIKFGFDNRPQHH